MSDLRKLISLYKSRKTIIHLLVLLGYNTEDYETFSTNEIDAMSANNQLDMLIFHKDDPTKKVYVKYYAGKQVSKKDFDGIVEDLYQVDNVLTKEDTLIIIMDDEPNDTNIAKMNYLYEHDGYFIVMHNIKRLQFNILEHQLVPKMTVLNQEESEKFIKNNNIVSLSQIPEISRYDPQALALCIRPNEICKIERNSMTALTCIYYRVCV
jgi:DNA-directed RNA polymerase subunit H (RpoH/RPB5)